jgi:hypothetical protein
MSTHGTHHPGVFMNEESLSQDKVVVDAAFGQSYVHTMLSTNQLWLLSISPPDVLPSLRTMLSQMIATHDRLIRQIDDVDRVIRSIESKA